MKVAEVARRAGVGAHAVRFYVRAGLLRAGRDPSNNYKQFGEPHVLRLRFIKGAQSLGFSLAEIRALLARMDLGERTCEAMHLQIADKVLELRQQIEDLVKRHAFMQRVYDDWRAGADGPHDLGRQCRFLEQQAASESSRPLADPGRLAALDHRTSPTSVRRRAGTAASSPADGLRASGSKPKSRAQVDSAGRRREPAGRAEGGLAVLDLLNREWRLPC
jgi:DNA-binding transcriptional MerR regulator